MNPPLREFKNYYIIFFLQSLLPPTLNHLSPRGLVGFNSVSKSKYLRSKRREITNFVQRVMTLSFSRGAAGGCGRFSFANPTCHWFNPNVDVWPVNHFMGSELQISVWLLVNCEHPPKTPLSGCTFIWHFDTKDNI